MATIASTALEAVGVAPLTPTQNDPLPQPFWVTWQDVRAQYHVQDAFYNFFFLKGEKVSLEESGVTYSATFFDSITATDSSGVVTTLGYFNPVSPKGLPSNMFNFNYGDVDPKTNSNRAGVMEVICGSELAITSVSEEAPSKFSIRATAPQMCSPKALYYYLKDHFVSIYDGSYWTYKIEFWTGTTAARIFQYHMDEAEPDKSVRYFVGQIDSALTGDDMMSFSGGDMCPATNAPFTGVVNVQCGCTFEIASVVEDKVCVSTYTINHPAACESGKVPKCSSTNLRAEIASHKASQLTEAPELPKKFPRDLVAAGTGVGTVTGPVTHKTKSKRAMKK
jgi:hypothetical protein